MKLSIITVNLNNRDGLQKTIDSVVSQTFHDFEWIVIDGGSTDGSKELIEQYSDRIAYWVSEPDSGIYNAMNKGIKIAQGEYFQFLNSGDWYCSSNSLESAFSLNPKADIAYADCNILEQGKIVGTCCYPEIVSLKEILDEHICHNSTFFRKELFDNNLYCEKMLLASDLKFLLQRLLENKSFEHVQTTLVNYDLGGISCTHPDLLEEEKKNIINEVIPLSIQKDLQTMIFLNLHKKDDILEKVDYFRHSSRIYRKFISASVMLMNHVFQLKKRKQI
jgi:glycosyltransferase involved in cell wall biosynthesis